MRISTVGLRNETRLPSVTAQYGIEHVIRYRAATTGRDFPKTYTTASLVMAPLVLRPGRPLAALEVRLRLGGSKCRCRSGKLPARTDSGPCPESGLPTTGPRCTSAGRAAGGGCLSFD